MSCPTSFPRASAGARSTPTTSSSLLEAVSSSQSRPSSSPASTRAAASGWTAGRRGGVERPATTGACWSSACAAGSARSTWTRATSSATSRSGPRSRPATSPALRPARHSSARPGPRCSRRRRSRRDASNLFAVKGEGPFTHVRLNIFPDGGVARLRVRGEVAVDLGAAARARRRPRCDRERRRRARRERHALRREGAPDPARAVATSMAEGWETRRRRGPGHDWALVRLGAAGRDREGRDRHRPLQGQLPGERRARGLSARRAPRSPRSRVLAGRSSCRARSFAPHARHDFAKQLIAHGPFTHVRLRIYPDGGVSRLRIHGRLDRRDGFFVGRSLAHYRVTAHWSGGRRRVQPTGDRWLDAPRRLAGAEAIAAFLRCCGSRRWAEAMARGRPYARRAGAARRRRARVRPLTREDWLEAFSHHPRIGDRGVARRALSGDGRMVGVRARRRAGRGRGRARRALCAATASTRRASGTSSSCARRARPLRRCSRCCGNACRTTRTPSSRSPPRSSVRSRRFASRSCSRRVPEVSAHHDSRARHVARAAGGRRRVSRSSAASPTAGSSSAAAAPTRTAAAGTCCRRASRSRWPAIG